MTARSRSDIRSKTFTQANRVALLEDDMDDMERVLKGFDNRLKWILTTLVSLLVAIALAFLGLALNLLAHAY